ncbi:hypothetical protein OR16_18236 [Cupriavidus basilensis OR16]|uniref:Uncharacterized protein n=1 Tax=Cupriavidus basilensis OR16 TaxID=1127483 RepID=H1S6U7_9BURK|nr:hypothetical protein OR16_18236 [Cupriavidus basilensis OR16]
MPNSVRATPLVLKRQDTVEDAFRKIVQICSAAFRRPTRKRQAVPSMRGDSLRLALSRIATISDDSGSVFAAQNDPDN